MIEINNLTKKFGERILFENMNLIIEDGEFVVFSGVSGCGKTTLLNMIGALESFEEGEILVDGKNIGKRRYQMDYFQKRVGFLFQNFALVDNKTVRQNLNMIAQKGRSAMSMEQALAEVGLAERIDTKIYKLSGGEQQRIALARLMVKKCDIVLADEPTGALDKKNAEIVLKILKKMNEQGKTIIMVTHIEEHKNIGNRIIHIG